MKKLFLLAGIALMSLNVIAQEKENKGLKGIWWIAGQTSFSSTKSGDAKTTSNMILPIVGTFISPSVTVGAGVGVMNGKIDTGSELTSETSTIVIKPLIRKYWNITGGLFFYGQAALPVTFGKDKVNDIKSSSYSLEVSPGFDYVVNKWLTVETSFSIFNVGASTLKPDSGDKTTTFGFNANPMNSVGDRQLGSLQVGVKFLF